MNIIYKLMITILLYVNFNSMSYALEKAFYILRSNSPSQITSIKDSSDSLTKHFDAVNILISQAYQIDQNGLVWGFVDPEVLSFANKHNMKLMVLVTNVGFEKDKARQFFANPAAQKRAIQSILDICEKQHYYGVQMDYEMIALDDRDALTHFYQTVADTLHKKGFKVSFAVGPLVSDNPQVSDFLKKTYEVWEGAYDLKALGQAGDFITVMAYNQHGEGTTPGPTASLSWVDKVVQYTLQSIPAEKLSLGVPVYSNYWYTSTKTDDHSKISINMTDVDFGKVKYLLHKYQTSLHWDNNEKINYAFFTHDWLNEYIFVEDDQSFKAKLDLAKKYNLRGISVFYIGIEDPRIWNVLG